MNKSLETSVTNEVLHNVATHRFLDPATAQRLDDQFDTHGEAFGELSIKQLSNTHDSWTGLFAHAQANSPLSSIDRTLLTVSYFDIEASRKRVLKGKLKFAKDQWGHYPIAFIANNAGFYHNSAKGLEKIAAINSVLSANSDNRKMVADSLVNATN